MQSIENINFQGKRALIRVDFNVPIKNETKTVTDDTRIKAAIPTINHVLENGGSVVLMSHLGRPKNGYEAKYSLENIVDHLSKVLNKEVTFAADCIGEKAFAITEKLESGEVVLLDNLRFYSEETAGDSSFAKKLSTHGDIYVNDAFGTAHRAHASTAIIAQFFTEKVFGKLMAAEIENIEKVLKSPEKPLTAIIGGAKVSSKIGIIEQLVTKVDHLIIGGGMAYTFWKAKGGNVGNSLIENDYLEMATKIMDEAAKNNTSIDLPIDTVIANEFSADAETDIAPTNAIPEGWMGLDIGPKSIESFSKVIKSSKTILWNGPMGVFEMEKFSKGTIAIAHATVDATSNGAYSLIGGGDSVAAINKFNLADKVSYVSTGGGAMLEYLEGKELPGIAAIKG
jgi:phosphoglycerate kinase